MAVEPIAIVGLSCRLPGGANDLKSLWGILGNGREAWSPVPPDRFNETAFFHPNSNDPNGTNNHRGGHFINGDVRDFDHTFFHLSPPVAAAMEPQQRILLELVYEALESARWPREVIAGSRTAVYAAVFGFDYERNLCKDVLDLPVYQSVGTGVAILANRISHAFDLRGPSVTIDTGCSGGLVALHQACQSLRSGESDAALVASANLQLMPDHYIGMSTQHMISSSGRCYPFDIRGEGYGRGEGFVVVAVKRLKDAIRDNDPIRSVILNTGVNQDGFTVSGITHPNRVAQANLIRETYASIGLRPQDVAYVEAHGTGTVAGDMEELTAIADVFATSGRSLPLYVGSNKGSIGHTESTSGLASLLKAICILDHGIIPPVAGFVTPKPGLPMDKLRIPTERLPWPENLSNRLSINSFGYGGTNAHVILEKKQRICTAAPASQNIASDSIFVFSANSQASLKAMLEIFAQWVEDNCEVSLSHLSHALCIGRSALPWRYSCVAKKPLSLANQLRQDVCKIPLKLTPSQKRIVFVFTGQGAQWAGMGRELLLDTNSSPFRDSIRASRQLIYEFGATWDLEVELLREDSNSNINLAEYAQAATTAVQIALVDLLRAQGIHPSLVLGHSSGEIAASYAAGHLSHKTALYIAFHRGFMAAAVKNRGLARGAMASVGMSERDVDCYLNTLSGGKVVVACINSPRSVTISGESDAVDEVITRIDSDNSGIFKRKLRTDTAYHSHHMSIVADEYTKRLGDLDLLGNDAATTKENAEEEVIFISSVTGLPKSSGFDSAYWVRNLVSQINFLAASQTTAQMHHTLGGGHAIFIEIGPHAALAGPMRQCLNVPGSPSLEYDYISVLQRGVDAISSTLMAIGRLFERGIPIRFDNVLALVAEADTTMSVTDLPPYPWDHSVKHWHESRLNREYRLRREPYHDLLGARMAESTAIEPRWRHMVGLTTLPWLADHVIDGLAVFPGAGYVCMAAEAIMQLALEQSLEVKYLAFRDISFLRGLIIPDAPQRIEMQLSLRHQAGGASLNYSFSIAALSDGGWNEQCIGFIEGITTSEPGEVGLGIEPESTAPSPCAESIELNMNELYSQMATDGNTYGVSFRGLRSMKMISTGLEATAVIEVPDIAAVMPAQHQASHILHPSTFDSMFHIGIPMIKRQHGAVSVMPVRIGELLISTKMPELSNPGSELEVAARITSNQFRATHIDMSAKSGSVPVLFASGIESRSLAPHTPQADDGTCYELEWQSDLEFLRANDLPAPPRLADLVNAICFKKADIRIIELLAKQGDVTATLLAAASAYGGTIATYDFTDITSELFDDSRRRLSGYPVSYRVLHFESDVASQGFTPNSYDVAVTSDLTCLSHISSLLNEDGILILVLKSSTIDDSWRATLSEVYPTADIQMVFLDAVDGNLIVLARIINTYSPHPPSYIQIYTHSSLYNTPPWVTDIVSGLHQRGTLSSLDTLSQAPPILGDEDCFNTAITLLRRKNRIIWLSIDEPMSMHQITGVARTAHAENDDLRLITFHVAPDALQSSRLNDMFTTLLNRVADQNRPLHSEREYRMRGTGEVLIPRLHLSDRLNRAIHIAEEADHVELEVKPFISEQPIYLSVGKNPSVDHVNFLEGQATGLADDAIEIDTQAFMLSKPGESSSFVGEYAGVVKRVGESVDEFTPGDAVVGLSVDGVLGHSRPHIPYAHAARRPDSLSPVVAAAIFLPLQGAVYALQHLALLPIEGAVVLIHGALSDFGRASLAVAQLLGARVFVTASNHREADEISQTFGIQTENIIVTRPSLKRCHTRNGNLQWNAIIVATRDPFLPSLLASTKPFGHVIFLSSTSIEFKSGVPRNVTLHFCDISELLQSCPELVAGLTKEAVAVLPRVNINGFKPVVHHISHIGEAFRHLNLGLSEKVVIEVAPNSLVRVALPSATGDIWNTAEAAYVVAGGMGDLGKRLLLLLAQRGAQHLVTLSRRTVAIEDKQAFEAQLQSINPSCRLYCLKCDVTSEGDVYDVADSLKRLQVPPIRGVIQSAAYLQDRTLETMTFETFSPVTLAKTQGTLNLEKVFATAHLDFFLMLSSAVVVTGASGQANYNAGNSVQDAIAHHRRPGFMSLNVGWIEDAIHTANDKTKLQGLWRTGLTPITPTELLRYFDYLLGAASSRSQIRQAVIGFNATSLSHTSASNSNVQSALFCHVRNSDKTGREFPSAPGVQSFKETMESGDLDEIVDFISSAIVGQLATLIAVDPTQVNPNHGSIISLGLDSLVAIELRNWITREFDASLQSSEIITDQPVRALAQKVASRSRIVSAHGQSDGKTDSNTENSFEESTSPPASTNSSVGSVSPKLPSLPLPSLEDTLRLFEASRLAIDAPDDQNSTSCAVRALIDGVGPELYHKVQHTDPVSISDSYERQVYLERREPLPETGQFTFVHPLNAPAHSQATRATVITVAAIDFASRLARNEIAPSAIHGKTLSTEGRDWIFYATRRPYTGVDEMERFGPNYTVAVLRRGHIFKISLPKNVEHRHNLESLPENATTLACLDESAFVVCLDDESPSSPGERYTQVLLNGVERPFANRWLDKTLQLVVTANGLSAETYEHTKIDGLDARPLHTHLCQAILDHPANGQSSNSSQTPYTVQECHWSPPPTAVARIEHIWTQCQSYGPLDYQTLKVPSLGLMSLRGTRSPPNATAHLAVLLATYLVDGEIRPAWEKVTLGTFARGRVDWVQTVSPAARDFIIAASTFHSTSSPTQKDQAELRTLFAEATSTHSRNITAASRGHGPVGALYALRAAAQEQGETDGEGGRMPEIFCTRAWDATRRGGPGQDIKIGFMRFGADEDESESGSSTVMRRGEAGFLVPGDRGIYVHCNVLETHAQFAVSGKTAYVEEVCKAFAHGVEVVEAILDLGRK
ncbi:polyketide synthase [Hypoxylon argillaceum]|nr:polyketide synthase [Hypoxylon argillaceum]